MKYALQASKPDWYRAKPNKRYYSATSGTHFLNEWYEFDNDREAIKYILTNFSSQQFIDNFVEVDGVLYETSSVEWDGDRPLVQGAEEADITDMVWAESAF